MYSVFVHMQCSVIYNNKWNFVHFFRKNVPDYSAARMMNDLGFISFDLEAGISKVLNCLFITLRCVMLYEV